MGKNTVVLYVTEEKPLKALNQIQNVNISGNSVQ